MKFIINEKQHTKLFHLKENVEQDTYYIGSEGGNNGYHHISQDEENVNEMRVFHGSGARFNKFNSDFNCSGEGSNCFGPGHYFTNSKKIGMDYATEHGTRESKIPNIRLKDYKNFNAYNQAPLLYSKLSKYIDLTWDGDFTVEKLVNYMNNCQTKQEFIHKVYQHLVKAMKQKDDYTEYEDWYKMKLESALNFLQNNIEVSQRSLYQVDIPNEGYAEWSSDVPEKIIHTVDDYIKYSKNERALNRWNKFLDYKMEFKNGSRHLMPITFEELYNALNNVDYEATFGDNIFKLALKRYNYIGMTYDAGMNFKTSSTKYGDKNYTVFDDDNVKITKRWDL